MALRAAFHDQDHHGGGQHLRQHGVLEPIGEMLRPYAQRERSFCSQRYLAYSVILHLWRSACLERTGEWHHRAVRQLDPRPT
jgi:hypothetical protein